MPRTWSKPFEGRVDAKFGAPMGRPSTPITELLAGEKWHLQRVPLVDGDYDKGGAYWGGGRDTLPLFCVWDSEGNAHYLRASSYSEAKSAILFDKKDARFYR